MGQDVTICCELKYDTDRAYLFFDGDVSVWIPKSQVRKMEHLANSEDAWEITIPEWLAHKSGLI
jgi:hypothetical protein